MVRAASGTRRPQNDDHQHVRDSLYAFAWERLNMLDLFFLILTAIFFGGCLAYILACERL